MPELRTDDAVRRLRGVWLGPDRFRLPVDWTYVEWGGFLAAWMVLVPVIGFALWALIGDVTAAGAAGLLFGSLAAWYARSAVTRLVDGDRPVRYWWRLVSFELAVGRVHAARHRWRAPVGMVAVFVVARIATAMTGRTVMVWLLVVAVPVWWAVTSLLDAAAGRGDPWRAARLAGSSAVVTQVVRVPPVQPVPSAPVVDPIVAGLLPPPPVEVAA